MTIEEHLSRKRVYDHGTLTAASREPRAITTAQAELDSESEETNNGFQIERVEFESDYLTIHPKLPVSTVPLARIQKNRKSAGREVNQAATSLQEKSPYG